LSIDDIGQVRFPPAAAVPAPLPLPPRCRTRPGAWAPHPCGRSPPRGPRALAPHMVPGAPRGRAPISHLPAPGRRACRVPSRRSYIYQISDAHAAAAHCDPHGSPTVPYLGCAAPGRPLACPDLFRPPSVWCWPVAPRAALPIRPGCMRFERRRMQGFIALSDAGGGKARHGMQCQLCLSAGHSVSYAGQFRVRAAPVLMPNTSCWVHSAGL
jgi:hypothetical protein